MLEGWERTLVFSGLRAWLGRRLELPLYLQGVDLPRQGWILELGAGTGWATVKLAQVAGQARVVGLDLDGLALAEARRAGERTYAKARLGWVQGDGCWLPFAGGTFSLVVALYTVHHVGQLPEVLREVRRVLVPGGLFLFVDPLRPGWVRRSREQFHGLFTAQEWREGLAEAGLRVEAWREVAGLWLWGVARA